MTPLNTAAPHISTGVGVTAQASDDQYAKEIRWDLPNGDKTVRGALLFYAYHEAWHLGQIAYARKGMGMEGLVRR